MEITKQVEGLKPEGLIIGNRPYVKARWLQETCQLTDASIRQNCSSNRKWKSRKIRGERYIDYDTISIRFKTDKNLPSSTCELGELLLADAKHQEELEKNDTLFFIKDELKDAFEHGYSEYVPLYFEFYPADDQAKKRRLCARKHAILKKINDLTDKEKGAHYQKKEVLTAYLALYEEQIKSKYGRSWHLFTDAPSMTRKLKAFKADTTRCITHGRINKKFNYNKKAPKLNPFTIAKIEQWASDKRAFSIPMVHSFVLREIEQVNQFRAANGKDAIPEISLSYVKFYLQQPEVRNTTMKYRNQRQYNRQVGRFIRRIKPEFACDQWMGDGTSSQIPYVDSNGKMKRASLFVFKDVMSGKITGFDVAENEDRHNLIDALHLAINTWGYAPREIVLDNASSTKTEEFKTIRLSLEKIGVIVRYARVGNAKDKAPVERWNRHFQNSFERIIPGFVGGGVQSKIDKDRIDEDFLKDAAAQGALLNWKQLQNAIGELIAAYNDTAVDGVSPNKRFEKSEKKNAYKLEAHEVAMMFWKSTIVSVRNQEIKITVRKQSYFYDLDHKDILKNNGEKVRVYYDESDFSTVQVFNDSNEYIGEVKQKKIIPIAKIGRDERDDIEILKQHQQKEKVDFEIDNRAAKKMQLAQDFIGADFDVYSSVSALESKEKIKAAENDVLLRAFRERKDIDTSALKPVKEVKQDTPYRNPDYGKKATNENLIRKAGSNDVLEPHIAERDDL